MAIRRALLIAPLLLALVGWAGTREGPGVSRPCGGCHEPHLTEVGSCTACHRGDAAALRKEIAHHRLLAGRAAEHGRASAPAVVEGRTLIERLACRRCHVVAGAGNGLATNLDRISWRREQIELTKSISASAENMPRFGLEESQVEAALAFLLRSAERDRAETTYRIRFATGPPKAGSVFEQHCGGCHRALTADGPLGRGSAGPNLSGLLSPHYPETARGGRGWTREALGKWLENPRAQRSHAAMRPVRLAAEESARLGLEIQRVPAGGVSDEGAPSKDDDLPRGFPGTATSGPIGNGLDARGGPAARQTDLAGAPKEAGPGVSKGGVARSGLAAGGARSGRGTEKSPSSTISSLKRNPLSKQNPTIREMTSPTLPRLQYVSKALANRARLRMLAVLEGRELCVGQVAAILDMARSTASEHLSELRRVDLVAERREGRFAWYSLETSPAARSYLDVVLSALAGDPTVASDLETTARVQASPLEEVCEQGRAVVDGCAVFASGSGSRNGSRSRNRNLDTEEES